MSRAQVVRWAILSRVCLLALQVLANNLIPDHEGSMNDVFMKDMRTPPHSAVVEVLFGGLDNWDAEYFIYISEHGYEYEQTMAFFPLLPSMMWFTSRTLLLPMFLFIPGRSVALVSGVMINFAAFVAAAVALYELTNEIFHKKKLSLISVALLCVNPASVFMSAVYTEATFMCFSLWGMLFVQRGRPAIACVLFAFAAASRSNGTVLCGYIGFYCLKELCQLPRRDRKAPHVCLLKSFGQVFLAVVQCCVVALPFILFQYFGYAQFCSESEHTTGSLSTPPPPWCHWRLPLPYFYIQQHYWDVGFMRYYQWKQIPNFALAAPMFLLCLYCLFQAPIQMLSSKRTKPFNLALLPYLLHLLFLVLFGILNMHVQVLTRLVASSSPVVYWCVAEALLGTLPPTFDVPDSFSQLGVAIFQQGPKEPQPITAGGTMAVWFKLSTARLIVCYFCAYYFIGCVVHCNFLPWT